jgi:hypothetical protein
MKRLAWMLVLTLVLMSVTGYSQSSNAAKVIPGRDLTQLFSRIWRVTNAPSKPASGSIYIFLANGTLLETSCVETYRIATWTIDKKAPSVLRVVEDQQLTFTAAITELTDTTLRLSQDLVRSHEKRTITLTAVEQEFVCPDMPK